MLDGGKKRERGHGGPVSLLSSGFQSGIQSGQSASGAEGLDKVEVVKEVDDAIVVKIAGAIGSEDQVQTAGSDCAVDAADADVVGLTGDNGDVCAEVGGGTKEGVQDICRLAEEIFIDGGHGGEVVVDH